MITNELNFTAALNHAIRQEGVLLEAYSAFHEYSIGNQILALLQCQLRGLTPGPLRTFKGWHKHNRFVKKGERALTLCMPITYKRKTDSADELAYGELEPDEIFSTRFMFKPRWFTLSQTDGEEFQLSSRPEWNPDTALANLSITRIPFTHLNGNSQGYARRREIAINPVAQLPEKTFLHEVAHVVLGHTAEKELTDHEDTPRSLQEVEAESVALVCGEALEFPGAHYCRGYIQNWLETDEIPEASAKRILGAADRILKAGRPDFKPSDQYVN